MNYKIKVSNLKTFKDNRVLMTKFSSIDKRENVKIFKRKFFI